jgi:hypothetical protein
MAQGTGPQRLVEYLESNWQATRAGRGDVPDTIKFQTGTEDPALNRGVLVVRDRERVAVDNGKHDLIHVYHPEAAPPVHEDNGYKEVRVVETVQVDIELTDRPDPDDAAGRLSAEERMVGRRADVTDPDEPPYPGIWGEVRYLLETIRRGLDEWDRVAQDPVNVYLGHANANVSINVELEQIATNTVQ